MRMHTWTCLLALTMGVAAPGVAAAVCGNGVVEAGEQCDDGNTTSGDGCSATCQFEGCSLTGTWQRNFLGQITVYTIVEDGGGGLSGVSFPPGNPGGITLLSGSRSGVNVTLTIGTSQPLTAVMTSCNSLPFTGGLQPPQLVRQRNSYCGDGAIDPGEACDDGNLANFDACSVACITPACGNHVVETPEQCDDGNAVNGDGCSTTCQTNVCGNGVLEPGEQCDDGNTVNGDGCSATLCQVNVCGNNVIEPGEQCDDGNVVGGDECSPTCQFLGCSLTGTWQSNSFGQITVYTIVEDGGGGLSGLSYPPGNPGGITLLSGSRSGVDVSVTYQGHVMTAHMTTCDVLDFSAIGMVPLHLVRQRDSYCGDGTIDAGEACDDGNLANFDACSVACLPSTCGNHVVETPEQCDDGNAVNGDGCSNTCQTNVCGNNVIESGEQCDDGNVVGGDECSPTCQFLGCSLTGTWQRDFLGDITVYTIVEDGSGGLSGVSYPADNPAGIMALSGSRSGVDVAMNLGSGPLTAVMTSCDALPLTGGLQPPQLVRLRDSYCGDGTIDAPDEECDDGNLANGDGCDVDCQDPPPVPTTSSTTSTSTSSTTSTTLALRSFQCYGARPASATSVSGLSLGDTFGTQVVDLTGAKAVCAPADEDTNPSGNPAHLIAYQIKAPPFTRLPGYHAETALGEVIVDVVKPQWLVVPSGSAGTPANPHHFTCYKVKRTRGTPAFVKQTGVGIDTPYEATAVDVLRPLRLCMPTDVAGTDPGAAALGGTQLVCYRARGSSLAATNVSLENELAAGSYDLRKRLELCLPTVP